MSHWKSYLNAFLAACILTTGMFASAHGQIPVNMQRSGSDSVSRVAKAPETEAVAETLKAAPQQPVPSVNRFSSLKVDDSLALPTSLDPASAKQAPTPKVQKSDNKLKQVTQSVCSEAPTEPSRSTCNDVASESETPQLRSMNDMKVDGSLFQEMKTCHAPKNKAGQQELDQSVAEDGLDRQPTDKIATDGSLVDRFPSPSDKEMLTQLLDASAQKEDPPCDREPSLFVTDVPPILATTRPEKVVSQGPGSQAENAVASQEQPMLSVPRGAAQYNAELIPRADGEAYSLRLQLPPSVNSLEVIQPAKETLRVNLDANQGGTMQLPSASTQVAVNAKASVNNTPEAADATSVRENPGAKMMTNKHWDAKAQHLAGFQLNPFYHGQAKQAVSHASQPGDSKLSAANFQRETNSRVPQNREVRKAQAVSSNTYHFGDTGVRSAKRVTKTPAMDTPSVDIRQLVRQKSPAEDQAKGDTAMIPVTIAAKGPMVMRYNELADFECTLTNPSNQEVKDFELRLTLPRGLQVTIIDREGTYDREKHTLLWKFDQLDAGKSLKLKYRVQSMTHARHIQSYEVGRKGKFAEPMFYSTSTTR